MVEEGAEERTSGKEIGEEEDDGVNEIAAREMKPWEQHSAVISIPRFDYKAPTSFLHRSFSGFLITCPIKREKSATKEAMSILEKYLGSVNGCNSEREVAQNVVFKRRRVAVGETEEECTKGEEKTSENESNGATTVSEGSSGDSRKSDADAERTDVLSLVKLTRSGLLLLTSPDGGCHSVRDVVSNVMQSLKSGSLKPPRWCHRIFPIQSTCVLHERELCTVVSRLVAEFMNNEGKELTRPIKFAVGYNRRGVEETEMKGAKVKSSDPKPVPLLDRSKCFEVVAAAIKNVVSDSVVDLKCPELAILIELLPVSGLPYGSPVVAVSVLPHDLVVTKPRLCIKPLVS